MSFDEENRMDNDEFLKWLKKSKDNRISEEHIKNGVNSGSRELVAGLCGEFEVMPNLVQLMIPFNKKAQILRYSEVYNLVKNWESEYFKREPSDLIKILYDIGFLGKFISGGTEIKHKYRHRYPLMQVRKSNKYYLSIFSFCDHFDTKISDTDSVVIAPMFWDYLDTKVETDNTHLIYATKSEEGGIRYDILQTS